MNIKIEWAKDGSGSQDVTLSEVYSGIGIETDMGLFGIAQRDGGIEVMLEGQTVWTSHEIAKEDWPAQRLPDGSSALSPGGPGVRPPDGSGAFVASMPLPKDHWLYAEGHEESPARMRIGNGAERKMMAERIRDAARYAIRASTMNGKEIDFDPDAMVQNMVVGMLGYWAEDGRSGA
jgi:hypothetical protein